MCIDGVGRDGENDMSWDYLVIFLIGVGLGAYIGRRKVWSSTKRCNRTVDNLIRKENQ